MRHNEEQSIIFLKFLFDFCSIVGLKEIKSSCALLNYA